MRAKADGFQGGGGRAGKLQKKQYRSRESHIQYQVKKYEECEENTEKL